MWISVEEATARRYRQAILLLKSNNRPHGLSWDNYQPSAGSGPLDVDSHVGTTGYSRLNSPKKRHYSCGCHKTGLDQILD
jgi:hypothetical protein